LFDLVRFDANTLHVALLARWCVVRTRGTNVACARTGTRSGVYQVFAGTSDGTGWERPPWMDLGPTREDRFPSSVRLSPIVTTGGFRVRLLVLAQLNSMTDRRAFLLAIYREDAKALRSWSPGTRRQWVPRWSRWVREVL